MPTTPATTPSTTPSTTPQTSTISCSRRSSGRYLPTALWLVALAILVAACGPESDGSHKSQETAADPTNTTSTTTTATPVVPGAPTPGVQRKPPLKALVAVLTEPEYEPELQVWTAKHMASIYPTEAAEMLATTLKSADPKVVIALIEGLTLDPDGRVRAALESIEGHPDNKVAMAAREKLSASN